MTKQQTMQKWADVKSFAELCDLAADFFEGKAQWHPTQKDLWEETEPLLRRLAAINRAGFLTFSSQPGRKEKRYWQREYVDGLAMPRVAATLESSLVKTSLYFRAYSGKEPKNNRHSVMRNAIVDSLKNGRPHGSLGNNRREVTKRLKGGCTHQNMDWNKCPDPYYLVVMDFEWGRQGYLFDTVVDCLLPSS